MNAYDFFILYIAPVINSVAYLSGGAFGMWRLVASKGTIFSKTVQAIFTLVWLNIGMGYLLYIFRVIDVMGLISINRPVVWITALPAFFGWFLDIKTEQKVETLVHRVETLEKEIPE